MERIKFEIPDLHCEGCAERSKNILEELNGVITAEVSFDDKTAQVEYDDESTDFDDIKSVLAKANYTAKQTAETDDSN